MRTLALRCAEGCAGVRWERLAAHQLVTLGRDVEPWTASPIKVVLIWGKLRQVDEWDSMELGALQTHRSLGQGYEVEALDAEMAREKAMWEAAKANTGHGISTNSRSIDRGHL